MPISACSAALRAGKKGAVDLKADLLPLTVQEVPSALAPGLGPAA